MAVPVVLVVDDEIGLLDLFSDLVERVGYETIRAESGQVALDVLDQFTPDLMILDLAMPGISGIDVLHVVQHEPRLDSMKVMVLTALGFTTDMEAVEERVQRWLKRPIMPQDFMEEVRAMFEED